MCDVTTLVLRGLLEDASVLARIEDLAKARPSAKRPERRDEERFPGSAAHSCAHHRVLCAEDVRENGWSRSPHSNEDASSVGGGGIRLPQKPVQVCS